MITNSCKLCTAGTCIIFIEKAFVMKIFFDSKSIAGGMICCQSQLCSGKNNVSKKFFSGDTEQQITFLETDTPRQF